MGRKRGCSCGCRGRCRSSRGGWRRGSCARGRKKHIRSCPNRNGIEQNRRNQRSSRRCARTRVGGSQGASRRSSENNQRRRDQAGGRRDEEKDRGGWGEGRNQIIRLS